MNDIIQQFFAGTLAGLTVDGVEIPCSQPPGDAEAQTWITFNEALGSGHTAGNEITRIRHLVQLHAWTHSDDDAHRAAFFAALDRLRAAGVRVYSWGPDDYEKDTGVRHIACTCSWWQLPANDDE